MRRCSTVAFALFLVLFSYDVRASEFGNAFGDASRKPSADALQALENIMNALKSIELQNEDGRKKLQGAAELLIQTAKEMYLIKPTPDQDPKLDYHNLTQSDRDLIFIISGNLNYPAPRSKIELYTLFSALTADLGFSIEAAVKSGSMPIYPHISGEISQYFQFAGLITRVLGSHAN